MNQLRHDLIAGFSVFLLALPLSLGIALASNFPPIGGIVSAIIGGIVASWFGGASLSIKGPAAGLIVIVLAAVQELGEGDLQVGFERTLAVGVVAALIQILLGLTRKAVIAEIMPPPVIHGMLAAIGVIIIAKTSYMMLGLPLVNGGPLIQLAKLIPNISYANPVIASIGLTSLAIALIWPSIKKISIVPSPIVVLLIAITISLTFSLSTPHSYSFMGHSYKLGPEYLIHLPGNLLEALALPDFSIITSWLSIKYIVMLALIGSIESLLTVCAVDSIKPQEKPSNLNHDLIAVGVGNLASSLIGGLPMISEVVRSKANIDYGARSWLANFFHGLFMLLAVLIIPGMLMTIPLASLAGLLVFVGFRLASPKEFIHMYQIGKDQFILFLATFFITLLTNLLIGILCGILLKLALLVVRGNNFLQLFNPQIETVLKGDTAYVEVSGPLTFAGYLQFKTALIQAKEKAQFIVVDFDSVTYIDHTVMVKLELLKKEFNDVRLEIQENQQLTHFYSSPLSSKRKVP